MDAQIHKTLGIVLRFDHQDTVSRSADVSGEQSDIADQLRGVNRQIVLLVNDHGFLRAKVRVGDFLRCIGNLDIRQRCRKCVVTFCLFCLTAVHDGFRDFLEETKAVFAVADIDDACTCLCRLFQLQRNDSGVCVVKADFEDDIGGKQLVDGVRGRIEA